MASPGSYKGVPITAGNDADVAAQIAKIDSVGTTTGYTSPAGPVNSIPSSALGTNTRTYSSYFPTATASTGLAETATASRDSYLAGLASDLDTRTQDQTKQSSAIAKLFEKLGLQSSTRANLYESEGLNADKASIDELTNNMEATGRSFDKQIENIQNNNPEGKLVSGVNVDVNNLTRQKAATLADQAIVLNARTRKYDTASGIIDRKVDAETEDLKTTLQGLQFFYNENKDVLGDEKSTLLQQRIKEADQEYQDARDLREKIGQIQLTAASNGAPVSVVSAIGKSADVESAATAAQSYLKAPKSASGGSGYDAYSDTEVRTVSRAGLGGSSEQTKAVFLSTPAAFQDAFIRNGSGSSAATPQNIANSLAEWEKYQASLKKTDDVDDLDSFINNY